MIRTTPAQLTAMRRAIEAPNVQRNEKVWTLAIANLFDHQTHQAMIVERMCGQPMPMTDPLDIWFEAQPISPRVGESGRSEGNTKLDLAFGHVAQRDQTAGGITYGPHQPGSWVCFVEAKCLSDCSLKVSYDPHRNQLARVIENLLCFQSHGQFPDRVVFTLLTPRVFKQQPCSRLYGYKMADYKDRELLLADIEGCPIMPRDDADYRCPDLRQRVQHLMLNWVTFEDLLELSFGPNLDIVGGPAPIEELRETLRETLTMMIGEPTDRAT